MPCKFTEGQLIRRVRSCPVSGNHWRLTQWPDGTKPRGSIGSVWTVSKVDPRGWLNRPEEMTAECWPIQLDLVTFPSNGFICACQFDPVGEEVPAEAREHEAMV